MSTIRTRKNKNYTTINNTVLNDAALTWKAKGLAVYLLSKPDDWKVQREHLAKQSQDGISAVRSALQELEKFGYLVRQRTRTERGIIEWEYILYEEPQNRQPLQERTNTRKKKGAEPSAENQPVAPSADNPPVDNPPADNPPADDRTLLNTNIVSTEELSTKKGARMESVDVPAPPTPPPAAPVNGARKMKSDEYDHPITADAPSPSVPTVPPSRPLIDGRKWKKGGDYLIAGIGETPTEVWYESFSINDKETRLTEPDEDDLKHCTDLEKLRKVITTCRRCNFKIKKNIQLILDWYRDGIPDKYARKEVTNGANHSRGGAQRPNQPVAPENYTAPAIQFYTDPDDPY